jgi:hypothetical protein
MSVDNGAGSGDEVRWDGYWTSRQMNRTELTLAAASLSNSHAPGIAAKPFRRIVPRNRTADSHGAFAAHGVKRRRLDAAAGYQSTADYRAGCPFGC